MKHSFFFFLITILLFSCKEQEARRPIVQKTSSEFSNVITESKKLNALENVKIEELIALDSIHTYQVSSKGFWYYYNKKSEKETTLPTLGNEVVVSYDIKDINGNMIYSKEELGIKTYKIDKEDFISGLQDGIKLMKVGETITFVVPFYRAFGVAGDGNRIGINQSIISTVTLIEIKKNEDN